MTYEDSGRNMRCEGLGEMPCHCHYYRCCPSPGPMGPPGPRGLQGPPGPAGATGARGPMGLPGLQGITGAAGPMGPQGEQGNTGPTGPQGPTGPSGMMGLPGPRGETGPQGDRGATGPAGLTPTVTVGPTVTGEPGTPASVTAEQTPDGVRLDFTIPRGDPGTKPELGFAGFATYAALFSNGSLIRLGTVTADPTGQIALADGARISLAPGYYQISYHVSAILRAAGYLQVTPSYGGAPHIEYGIYFKTAGDQASAYGSNSLVLEILEQTDFTLTYNGSEVGTDGAATIAVIQLRRA